MTRLQCRLPSSVFKTERSHREHEGGKRLFYCLPGWSAPSRARESLCRALMELGLEAIGEQLEGDIARDRCRTISWAAWSCILSKKLAVRPVGSSSRNEAHPVLVPIAGMCETSRLFRPPVVLSPTLLSSTLIRPPGGLSSNTRVAKFSPFLFFSFSLLYMYLVLLGLKFLF